MKMVSNISSSKASKSLYLIIGLGKTGLSCAEYLDERRLPFRAMDTRTKAPFADQITEMKHCLQTFCGDPSQHLDAMNLYLENVTQVIVSPGVALEGVFFERLRARNISIIGDIELFARELDKNDKSSSASASVIAITGSNGKSTVTELTFEMLKAAGKSVLMGGNIGIPVLDLLKQQRPDFYVLELSSFQLETTETLKPIAGTVLNITEDHMDRYESFEQYSEVKLSLLKNCQAVIINRDEFPELDSQAKVLNLSLSLEQNADESLSYHCKDIDGEIWITNKNQPLVNQADLKIAGLHNVSNAMVAFALCEASGVETTVAMIEALKQWPGLKHRCEFVREMQGIRFYNDSKATNVGATLAAITGLSQTTKGQLILIAGGDGKGADFAPLQTAFSQYLKALVLLGNDAQKILEQAGGGLLSVIVKDMKEAVSEAYSMAQSGDVVLLSPACASFDMYKNFEQRGEIFKQEVEAAA